MLEPRSEISFLFAGGALPGRKEKGSGSLYSTPSAAGEGRRGGNRNEKKKAE